MKTITASIALLIVVAGSVAQGAIYDATVDFTPGVMNPNGVWSYGYSLSTTPSTTPDGTFIPAAFYGSDGDAFGWQEFPSAPAGFYKRISAALNGVTLGQTFMHGGPFNEFAILRFTAP